MKASSLLHCLPLTVFAFMLSPTSLNSTTLSSKYRFGAGIAIESTSSTVDLKTDFTDFGQDMYGNQTQKDRVIQFAPSLEFGLQLNKEWYMGLYTCWHPKKLENTNNAYLKGENTLKHDFTFSSQIEVLAKVGYQINDKTMLYTKIGPSFAKWSHKTTQKFQGRLFDTFTTSKNSVGVALAIGFETSLSEKTYLSMDYTYTFYKKQNAEKSMRILENFGGGYMLRATTKPVTKSISPSTGTLALRLTYFF